MQGWGLDVVINYKVRKTRFKLGPLVDERAKPPTNQKKRSELIGTQQHGPFILNNTPVRGL